MRRQEYIELVNDWNSFLLKEEKRLLNEELILENFLLNEGLRDIANKFGKPGLKFLVSLVLANSTAIPAASAGLPAHVESAFEDLRNSLTLSKSRSPYKSLSDEDKRKIKDLSRDDNIVAEIEHSLNLSSEISMSEFLKPADLKAFSQETGEKVFTKASMSITKLPGLYIKETFSMNAASEIEIHKIIKKAKKIYENKLDERVFFIKVNNKKYAVLVESDAGTNKDKTISLLDKWSKSIANNITYNLISNLKSEDKDLIKAAKSCNFNLAKSISEQTFDQSITNNPNSYGGFVSVKVYNDYFIRCFGGELSENSSFSFDNNSLMGIIFLPPPFFEKLIAMSQKISTIEHELGHLLSDQSNRKTIDTFMLRKFYNFINKKNKTNSFNLKDIAYFLFQEDYKDLTNNEYSSLPESYFALVNPRDKMALLKGSKLFARQLLGSNSIEKVDDLNFSFTLDITNAYFSNLEERIENVISTADTINIELSNSIKKQILKHTKSKNPLIKKSELQKKYRQNIINFTNFRKKEAFESLLENISNFTSNDSEFNPANHIGAKFFLKSRIKSFISGKIEFNNFDVNRLVKLINLSGFGKSQIKGKLVLKKSIENIRTIFEKNFGKRIVYDHDHEQN